MVAKALQNRGLIPSSPLNVSMNVIPNMNVGGMGTPRTTPFSTFTTPRSYSALNTGGMSMGANNPGGRFSALPAKEGSYTLGQGMPQNTFVAGMEQGAKNVYAKPAFVRPTQQKPNVPPNQLGQNLLDFASSPQGIGFARGLLEASGYSTTPVSFGQALAQGMAYMTEADKTDAENKQQEFENFLKQEQLDIQKAEAERNQEAFNLSLEKQKQLNDIFTKTNRDQFDSDQDYYNHIANSLIKSGNIDQAAGFLELAKPTDMSEYNDKIIEYNKDEKKTADTVKAGLSNFEQIIDAAKAEGGEASYALMIKFIKQLDDSVVREGEVRSFEGFQGLFKNLKIKFEKAKGSGFPDEVRLNILNLAQKTANRLLEDYREYVSERSINLYGKAGYDPERVFAGHIPNVDSINLDTPFTLEDLQIGGNNEDEIFVTEEEVRKGAGKVPR